MTTNPQRVDVARLSELLSGIVGDYKVCLGVSQKAFKDFSLRGSSIGKLPNQSWGLHCRRRIEELEALPALLQQLAERDTLIELLRNIAERERLHMQTKLRAAERAREAAIAMCKRIVNFSDIEMGDGDTARIECKAFLAANGGGQE